MSLTVRIAATTLAVAAGLCAVPGAQRGAPPPAMRIVSVVPSATEILFALGAGAHVVGIGSYDEVPAGTPDLPRVGALIDPDTERILSLRPDLVVVYGSQDDLQARLRQAGIRTYSYRHAGLRDVFDTIRELAALTGRPSEGARLVGEIGARLDAVERRVRGRPRPRTLLVIDREPGSLRGVYVSGGRGFLHEMVELAGGVNVFADVDRESAQPSTEILLARGPEVIIEIRAAAVDRPGDREVWQRLPAIPAVRDDRVFVLAGQHLVVPGSRIAEGADALARVLHPGAFR